MGDFTYVEGTTNVKEIVKALVTNLTTAVDNPWTLVYPANISGISDLAIVKTVTSKNLEAFVQFERPENALNHITITIGSRLSDSGDSINDELRSESARYAWYRESNDIELYEWTTIQYWMSFSRDFANIVLQGDPSLDIAPYKNYLISWAYIGTLESFDESDEDDRYNFGLTVSSDIFPDEKDISTKYGKRTATCITDVGMLGTRTGTPFQSHFIKMSTPWEFVDKNYITSSQWTHKHHMSDIIICHAYDRERGKLQNVLIGDRSAIFHLDVLLIDKGKETEKEYVAFNINAPYSILNNGPNVLYGIALRKK